MIYTNKLYTVIFVLFFASWVASELLGPARWQGSSGAQRRDRGSTAVLALSTGVGVVFYFWFPLLAPKTTMAQQLPLFWVGVAVALVGTALRWRAIQTLGESFTGSVVLEEAQKLVRHGPYRLIRHPAYTGILLVVVGFGLMMANWGSLLAITIGMFAGLLYRISIEEAALCQYFGKDYRDYMACTKRLIPFLL